MSDIFGNTGLVQLPAKLANLPKLVVTANNQRIDGDMHLMNVQCGGESNIQVDQTFGGDTYVTAFGEKLTASTITGLAVLTGCGPGGAVAKPFNIVDLYKKYRAGTAKGNIYKIAVSYSGNVFTGFMTALSLSPYQAESPLPTYSFTLKILGKFV